MLYNTIVIVFKRKLRIDNFKHQWISQYDLLMSSLREDNWHWLENIWQRICWNILFKSLFISNKLSCKDSAKYWTDKRMSTCLFNEHNDINILFGIIFSIGQSFYRKIK